MKFDTASPMFLPPGAWRATIVVARSFGWTPPPEVSAQLGAGELRLEGAPAVGLGKALEKALPDLPPEQVARTPLDAATLTRWPTLAEAFERLAGLQPELAKVIARCLAGGLMVVTIYRRVSEPET